jgi:hypothetical protein
VFALVSSLLGLFHSPLLLLALSGYGPRAITAKIRFYLHKLHSFLPPLLWPFTPFTFSEAKSRPFALQVATSSPPTATTLYPAFDRACARTLLCIRILSYHLPSLSAPSCLPSRIPCANRVRSLSYFAHRSFHSFPSIPPSFGRIDALLSPLHPSLVHHSFLPPCHLLLLPPLTSSAPPTIPRGLV